MPTPDQYIKHIRLMDRLIKSKTEGITHEQSMRQLPFPANCMNWNLGHLLVYRMQYLGVIDGVSQPDPAEFALYGNGSEPLTDSDKAIPLATLLARLDSMSERIISALETMPADRLTDVYDADRGTTVDDRLHFYLVFHESYHVGQLEILYELAQVPDR